MSYDAQVAAKQLIIRDSLQRIGKRSVELPPIERSPLEWRYRTKLTLAMRRRGARWIAGLHPYDNPTSVFPLADCPITDRRVVAAWREVMDADAYFPDARELRGSMRITSGGPTFVMMGGTSWPARDQFSAGVPSVSALWWEPEAPGARVMLYDRRSDRTPSASFAQINAPVAAELASHVVARTKSYGARSVIDAYAGAGQVASLLAEAGMAVIAIELDADASAWSTTRLTAPSRAVQGRVEDELPALLPADVVILNPPRAGVDARVTEMLEANSAATTRVIYVSCNPATLARDVSRLPSFRIESLRAFDMFPQTAHVETVCELTTDGGQA
jgi:23S rRNA (uracil1939-C5)-methyltransferase